MNKKLSIAKRFSIACLSVLLATSAFVGAVPTYAASYSPSSECTFVMGDYSDYKPNQSAAKPSDAFTVILNGEIVKLSDPIVTINGSTFLPVRAVAELMNINVDYSSEYKVAIATNEDTTLEIPIGYSYAVRNGKVKEIGNGNRSIIYKERTYLPLRFIADQFESVSIDYAATSKSILITTSDEGTTTPPTSTTQPPTVTTPPSANGNGLNLSKPPMAEEAVAPGQLSPSEVCAGSRNPQDIAAQYFKDFKSVDEVNNIIKHADGMQSACEIVFNNSKYVLMNVKISKEKDFLIGGGWVGTTWHMHDGTVLPSQFNNAYVFKDGTYTKYTGFPNGKTIEDLDYFYYSIDNVYYIYKVTSVDTTGILN